jgi:hypothetical protein
VRSRLAPLRRILPWISLCIGVASALTMDRRPERAPVVALAAAGGWLLLAALALLESVASHALLARAARFGAAMGSQSLMQLCLFFSLPFFVRAAEMPAQWGFVGLLVAASAVTLWSPLGKATLRHAGFGAALQAVATFAGLDCVLPLLGLSNRVSLVLAVLWTVAGLPLLALARRRRLVAPSAVALGVVLFFLLGGARVVPPAPLRLVEGQIGSRVAARRLLGAAVSFPSPPAELICYTAIAAPRGLRDRLHHVWRQDGVPRSDVALEIRGGRTQGFRTWSTYRGPSRGTWTCTVETESGQRLGRVQARVGK